MMEMKMKTNLMVQTWHCEEHPANVHNSDPEESPLWEKKKAKSFRKKKAGEGNKKSGLRAAIL